RPRRTGTGVNFFPSYCQTCSKSSSPPDATLRLDGGVSPTAFSRSIDGRNSSATFGTRSTSSRWFPLNTTVAVIPGLRRRSVFTTSMIVVYVMPLLAVDTVAPFVLVVLLPFGDVVGVRRTWEIVPLKVSFGYDSTWKVAVSPAFTEP